MTDAAGAPIDALTAHQGLTDVLSVSRGDDVLITAGAGGLGHFAVQIARILGARIVATASPEHHEFVHHAGAAVVIDHTRPETRRVNWQVYDGQPSGSRLIRMAPWFDDGLLSVQVAARYYYQDAASAHRRVEKGHTQGKLVLAVDDDLALEWEV